MRLYIRSWFSAVAVLAFALLGLGTQRRRAMVVSVVNVIGFPLLFFTLLNIGF